jgi:hypothetical protein
MNRKEAAVSFSMVFALRNSNAVLQGCFQMLFFIYYEFTLHRVLRCLLLFIAKARRCWELTFATDSNSSKSSVDSSSRNNDSGSDRADTSELAQPLAE